MNVAHQNRAFLLERIELGRKPREYPSGLGRIFHDDLADPKSSDPVLRQSTRVCAAAVTAGQTSIDPKIIAAQQEIDRYQASSQEAQSAFQTGQFGRQRRLISQP